MELTFKGQDLDSPSEAAHAPWLAVAHSPYSWPSHVKIRCIRCYCPNCLSWVSTSLVFVALTLPVAPDSLYFSVWLAGETERQREGGILHQGKGGLLFLGPQCFPASLLSFSTLHTHRASKAWSQTLRASTHACLQRTTSWLTPLALTSCPACVALDRSFPVSLVTFAHISCLLHLILETSLDFLQHFSHLCGPHMKSTPKSLVA